MKRLRWDHADIPGYCHFTGLRFLSILSDLSQFELGNGFNATQGASQVIESVSSVRLTRGSSDKQCGQRIIIAPIGLALWDWDPSGFRNVVRACEDMHTCWKSASVNLKS